MALSDGLCELEVGLHLEEHCQLKRQGLRRREQNIPQVIRILFIPEEDHQFCELAGLTKG